MKSTAIQSRGSDTQHGFRIFFPFFILLLSYELAVVGAQPNPPESDTNNSYNYTTFTPSMAIIISVLIASFFLVGFLSLYISRCSGSSGTLGSVRRALSMRRRAAGLDPSVIETFPTFTYSEVKDHKIGRGALECAVCLNEFEADETLRLIPKCDHVFHPGCIDEWLGSHSTCPVCRANLVPGEETDGVPPDMTDVGASENLERISSLRNEEVVIQVAGTGENQPEDVNRNRDSSFENTNRPPRSFSIKRLRTFNFGRFRSHSTGHSLVQPNENLDRFTLRLPEDVRKEMLDRARLNRTKSFATRFPGEGSSRRGYRTGGGEGSRPGGRWFDRSNRWSFNMARPVFSRGSSMKSPRGVGENGEGSSKGGRTPVKMPSFKCLEPKTGDETSKVSDGPIRSPV